MKRSWTVVAVLALVAAACGGAADGGSGVASLDDAGAGSADTVASLGDAAVTEDGPQTDEAALLAFAACMRDNGIDLEDPTVDADGNLRLGGLRGGPQSEAGADREAAQAAFAECGDLIDNVALGFRGEGIDQTEREDTLLAFAACVRENGYDMPDPDFDFAAGPGGGGGGTGPFGEIDRNDPTFVSAQEACSDVLAGFGPGGGLGRPPGGGGG